MKPSQRPSPSGLFEALESRTLFAVGILSQGILRVAGDGASTNTIIVSNSSDGASVVVSVNSTNARGVDKSFNKSFPKGLGISEIRVKGGGKNDVISVGQANALLGIAALDLPSRVLGLGGNDLITTAGGNDIVFGGAGNDELHGGSGSDYVYGHAGNDTIFAEGGSDFLAGYEGNDVIYANDGAMDHIWKYYGGGTDTVFSDSFDAVF